LDLAGGELYPKLAISKSESPHNDDVKKVTIGSVVMIRLRGYKFELRKEKSFHNFDINYYLSLN